MEPSPWEAAQLLKNFQYSMEHKGSLWRSQKPTIDPYPEPDEFILHHAILFLYNP
jgi:hypothetical protein